MVLAVFVVLALVIGVAMAMYGRQIVSYLSHRRGGPSVTVPYVPWSPPPDVHIAAAGDTGDSGARLDEVGAAIAAVGAEQRFDTLVLLGDLVYPAGDADRIDETVFQPFGDVLAQGTDLAAVLGNHDVKDGEQDRMMAELGMPGRWWSTTIGSVLLVGLDTTSIEDPTQQAFLEDVLAGSGAPWKIVVLHHPPYSAGYQGSNLAAREAFSPLFERYGVQLVLSGHDHDYQRSVPIDDVTYIVSGAGSGTRRTGTADFTAVAWSFRHFTDIAVYDDQLCLRAVGADGEVADEAMVLPSADAPPPVVAHCAADGLP